MSSVTITNKRRRMQVFNLPYQIMGPNFMRRQLCGTTVHNGKTGERRVRGGMKRVSDSVTLLAKGKMSKGKRRDQVTGLPPCVVRCPDVMSAKAAGHITVDVLDEAATKSQAEKAVQTAERHEKQRAAVAALAAKKLADRDDAAKARAEVPAIDDDAPEVPAADDDDAPEVPAVDDDDDGDGPIVELDDTDTE